MKKYAISKYGKSLIVFAMVAYVATTAFGYPYQIKFEEDRTYYRDMDSMDGIHYLIASEPELSMWLLQKLTPERGFTLIYADNVSPRRDFGAPDEDFVLSLDTPCQVVEGSAHSFRLPPEVYDVNGHLKSAAIFFNAETFEITVKERMDRVQMAASVSFENHSVLPVYGPVTLDFEDNIYWNRFWLYDQPQLEGVGSTGEGDDFTSYDYMTFGSIFDGNCFSAKLIPDEKSETLYTLNPNYTCPLVDSQYRVIDLDFSQYSWTVDPVKMISSLSFPEEKITLSVGESVQLQPDIVFVSGVDTKDFRLVWHNDFPWGQAISVSRDGLVTAYEPTYPGGFFTVTAWANDASGLSATCEIEVTDNASVENPTVEPTNKASRCYDMQGRALSAPPAHGIYILDGRKIVR